MANSPTDADDAAGLETARLLLDIKAVNFRPEEPYKFTAGWASPVYIDCRWVISFPEVRQRIMQLAGEKLQRENPLGEVDQAGVPYPGA